MPVHHTIDYIEYTVRDIAEAKSFFAAAFGWAFNDYGPEYAGIRAPGGEGEVGGLRPGEPARYIARGQYRMVVSDLAVVDNTAREPQRREVQTTDVVWP